MPRAAQAPDEWADAPEVRPIRRRRREAVDWASADELEVLGGLGREPRADWSVLTLERDDADRDPVERVAAPVTAANTSVDPIEDMAPAPAPTRSRDRRTVVIRGNATAPRAASAARRRPPQRTRDRFGHNPDRIAAWAVVLGLLLILAAAGTANAATIPF